jgi:hypothetical protein
MGWLNGKPPPPPPPRWLDATAGRIPAAGSGSILEGIRSAIAPAPASTQTVPGSIKKLELDLTVARTDAVFDIGGDVVWFFNSTASTDVVGVRINDNSDVVDFSPGNAIGGYRFSRLKITNGAISGGHTAVLLIFNSPDEIAFANRSVRAV